jgi:16S rRNA (uracil1498-N3)-methyltransferase
MQKTVIIAVEYNKIMQNIPRFYINKLQINRKRFLIEDERSVRHMGLVLRMKKGDKLVLFDGEGFEYEATLGFLTKKLAAGVIDSETEIEIKNKVNITIAQSLPRAGKLDDVVRMNTEVGVESFIFFESEYSVAKKESFTTSKIERLNKVALEALRQSEGIIAPKLTGPFVFGEVIALENFDYKILLHSRNIKDSINLATIKNDLKPSSKVLLIIGPEGGFSPKEVKLAQKSGCAIAYLNLPILRTETAGVVVSSFLSIS